MINPQKTKNCSVCKGYGLVLYPEKVICRSEECNQGAILNCMYCENIDKTRYIECNKCLGSGIRLCK